MAVNLLLHRKSRDIAAIVLLAPKKPAGLKPTAAGAAYAMRFNDRHDPTFTAEPMVAFTNYLSNMWQSPVVDQSGLEGTFDFSQPFGARSPAGREPGDRVLEAVIAIGFKVEERKVPTEITVVDRCERLSEN